MAEFHFILGENEQSLILNELIKDGASIVPYLAYESPCYQEIKNSSEVVKIVRDRLDYGPFFVSWPEHRPHPYDYDQIGRSEGIRYFLKQKHGGPYLDLLASRVVEKDKNQLLTTGFIAYYTKYWIDSIKRAIPVSEQLKHKYEILTKSIKSISTRNYAGKRVYWIGNEAMHMLQSGYSSSIDGLSLGNQGDQRGRGTRGDVHK